MNWLFYRLLALLAEGEVPARSGHRFAGVTPVQTSGHQAIEGSLTLAPEADTEGGERVLTVTGAAHTGVEAATELSDVRVDLERTVTWATGGGTLAMQRAVSVTRPTYAAAAAMTITAGATIYVKGAPTAGTNITLTNAYALWIDADAVRFDGMVIQNAIGRLNSTTDTGATPTVATPAGIVRVPSGSTSVTVTCAACTTGSIITGAIRNVTTNACYLQSIVPGNGSFVVTVSADPGASHADIAVIIALAGTGV